VCTGVLVVWSCCRGFLVVCGKFCAISSSIMVVKSSKMERYNVEDKKAVKGSHERANPSHERANPNKTKGGSSSLKWSVHWSQRCACVCNWLWRKMVGTGGGVRCDEALITCRLIFASGSLGSREEKEDMVWPGGRPESAHRLRIPMVRTAEKVRQR
jgi:hypothetical protein